MFKMSKEVLCPLIAEKEIIITESNIDGLLLSDYERVPGTEVIVSCISENSHKLIGAKVVTCLRNGQWNNAIPVCTDQREWDEENVVFPTAMTGNDTYTGPWTQYGMMPYIVALVILGIACLVLISLLSYLLHVIRKRYSKTSSIIYDSSRSSIPTSTDQTDFWVELATARNFRCHELAGSHDSMVRNLRYTHMHPDWSGY